MKELRRIVESVHVAIKKRIIIWYLAATITDDPPKSCPVIIPVKNNIKEKMSVETDNNIIIDKQRTNPGVYLPGIDTIPTSRIILRTGIAPFWTANDKIRLIASYFDAPKLKKSSISDLSSTKDVVMASMEIEIPFIELPNNIPRIGNTYRGFHL
jgi:hypothetical protein